MKNAIIRGTLILTIAGLLSRLIGFYYRIFLSNTIGAEGMGLYQLVFPVFLLSFAICVGGIETAISKFVASSKNPGLTLLAGSCISFILSILLSSILFFQAEYIADRILLNPDEGIMIRILSAAIPFVAVENCINGYYYGQKKAIIPAMSQLFEQTMRVLIVFLVVRYCSINNHPYTSRIAMYGLVAGEAASFLFSSVSLFFGNRLTFAVKGIFREMKRIIKLAFPVSVNRILLTLLQSGEAILLPAQLIACGMTNAQSLSIYGILTGMALPLIMFPSTITNSVSIFLLPTVSKAQAEHNSKTILSTVTNSIKYSLALGIFFTTLFIVYGARTGSLLFHDNTVGYFIEILAWLCPFLYITTTTESILNGLGKTTLTCVQNIGGILVRILFLILFVPKYGIYGYLWGLLLSQILLCTYRMFSISRICKVQFNPKEFLILPFFCVLISTGISFLIYYPLERGHICPEIIRLLIGAGIAGALYCAIYYWFSDMRKKNRNAAC